MKKTPLFNRLIGIFKKKVVTANLGRVLRSGGVVPIGSALELGVLRAWLDATAKKQVAVVGDEAPVGRVFGDHWIAH